MKASKELKIKIRGLVLLWFNDINKVDGRFGETTSKKITEFIFEVMEKLRKENKDTFGWFDELMYGWHNTNVVSVMNTLVREKQLVSIRRGKKTYYQVYNKDKFPNKGTRRVTDEVFIPKLFQE